MSRNVSVLGLLLNVPVRIPIDSHVSFTVNLQGEPIQKLVQLAGDGRIRRVEPCPPASGFTIAVACEHPIVEVGNRLPLPD